MCDGFMQFLCSIYACLLFLHNARSNNASTQRTIAWENGKKNNTNLQTKDMTINCAYGGEHSTAGLFNNRSAGFTLSLHKYIIRFL